MPTVDEMRIVMDAETARLFRKLNEADRRMAQFQAMTKQRLENFDRYFRSAGMAAGALTGALGTGAVIEYANAWTRTERALRASEDIFGIPLHSASELIRFANEARIDVEAYAKTYVRTAAAIRDYGYDANTAARFTSTLSMALKLGSATSSEQASVLLQVSQALQKGKLDGDEFRSVMENAGVVQELLAERLKVSKGEIVSMAKEGRLKVQDLVAALTDGAAKIERLFRRAPQTIDEAMSVLKNSMIEYVGKLDHASGGTQKLISLLNGLASNIDNVGNGALVVGAGLLTAFGPRMLAGVGALGGGLAAMLGPFGLVAGLVGSSAAAMGLFGDKVAVTADGMVTLKDTSLAVMDVIGAKLTPLLDDAGALWSVAVAKIQEALAGLPVSFSDIADVARAAVNATIGVFMFAAKSIQAAFTTLPAAIGEQFITMANRVIETVESLVANIVAVLSVLPGINITPNIDLGRISNPLTGAGTQAREAMADAGRQLGRDFVAEFGAELGGVRNEIAARAREIAEQRRWMDGTSVKRDVELKRGKPPFDDALYKKQLEAYQQMQEVYKKALDATQDYMAAVQAEYEKDLSKYQELLRKKIISQEEFNKVQSNLAIIAAKEMLDAAEKQWRKLREITDSVASNMQSAFDGFVENGKFSFSDFARSVIQDLAKIAFKMMVLQPLFGASGQGFGVFGSLLGLPMGDAAASGWGAKVIPAMDDAAASGWGAKVIPAFAEGGRPPVGMPSIVGEKGPELFIPDVSGRIVPNKSLGSGGAGIGGEIVVTVAASSELHATIESTAEGVVARKAPAIVGASVDATRRNLPGMLKSAQRRSL